MCTVQAPVCVDVMRFESLRRDMAVRSRHTCRRLFACEPNRAVPDPQAMMRLLRDESSERAERRWNFDFQRERPLPGRFQWVPVGAPLAKEDEIRPQVPEKEVAVVDEIRPQVPEDDFAVVDEIRPEVVAPKEADAPPKQSKITDYMSHRKRRSSTSASSPKLKTRRGNTGNSSCNTTTSTDFSSVSSS